MPGSPIIMNDVPTDHRVLESIPDAVVVTAPDGEIVFVNLAAEKMTGYRRKELAGKKVEVLVPARLRGVHVRHRRNFYAQGVPRVMGEADRDFMLRRKDGSEVAVEISLGPAGEDTVAVIRDVTERRRMEEALEHRALHDPLTDLANRSLFFDRLQQALHSARRQGTQLAVVMIDLDGFKAVNDAFGHAAGDEVLKVMAGRLASEMRATDTAARIGGDEFAWILPRIAGRRAADRLMTKRLSAAREPIAVDGKKVDLGVSAGVAIYPDDGRDADSLIRHADAAMYSAKRRHEAVRR
jgi:diguanylate cyclase (GGDEF)-like protein/PAS domain S-box-containing protein